MAKPKKTREATEELLATMRRIQLDPLEVMQRAIILAEREDDYKAMMDGALGVMPYMYPKLKESVVKADIDQNLSGNGVSLNITIGDQKVVDTTGEE
uniref:Terminase small subunit n=1 Tax=Salmonella phage vB_SEnST11_KE24 TaxID=3161175 RepID=A0AAU8GIF9_9CAUD